MASRGSGVAVTLCPACLMIGDQPVGHYRAIEIEGRLFDGGMSDEDALSAASELLKQHALKECDGEISHECLQEYAEQEIAQPASPLSKLFAPRVRARKCPYCGCLTKLSRLP